MEIDLYQLPIPDWDVACPRCAYALRGLPNHRCPECGLELDMDAVVKPWSRLRDPWFSGDERPLPAWGFMCEHCRQPLEGAFEDACSACARPFPAKLRQLPRPDWFVLTPGEYHDLSLDIIEVALLGEYVPHRREAAFRPVLPVVPVLTQSWQLSVARAFYFDALYLIERERRQIQSGRERSRLQPLRCSRCGEESPANFAVCWSCGESLIVAADD